MRWMWPLILGGTLWSLVGCGGGMFAATGTVASESGRLGTWSSTPEGCSRDPQDGLPVGESRTNLSFFWQNPAMRDPLRDQHRATAPDAPLRLELERATQGTDVELQTVLTGATTHFNDGSCSSLRVELREQPAAIPEGRPTLAGTVTLDCLVRGSHLTAHLSFERCGF